MYTVAVPTVGVVALSVLAGMLMLALLVGIGITIWASLRVWKASQNLATKVDSVYAETKLTFGVHREEMVKITESARSTFRSLKEEMRQALEFHQAEMKKAVEQVNATALEQTSKRMMKAMIGLERLIGTLNSMLLDQKESPAEVPVGQPWPESRAEEYAPTGANIYDQSLTGRSDMEAFQDENAEVISDNM